MGIFSLISLFVGVAGAAAQRAEARKAAAAQTEGRNITVASQKNEDRLSARRNAREERIRRARLISSSEAAGASGSSGSYGAISSIGADFSASFAGQTAQSTAAQGVSTQNQLYANAQQKYDEIGAFTSVVQKGLSLWEQAAKPV
jgi:hypothetical protein